MAIYMTIVFKTTGPAVEGLFDDDFSVKVVFFERRFAQSSRAWKLTVSTILCFFCCMKNVYAAYGLSSPDKNHDMIN